MVLRQFLIESVTLSVMGGLVGISFGVGIAECIGHFTTTTVSLSLSPVLYSFFFSLLVGVVFGVYPARKVSLLNPIDALRYE